MKRIVLCTVVAACGGAEPAPDATVGCSVELTGNLVETTSSMTSCPALVPGVGASQGDTLVRFTIASHELGGDFRIDLDLGQMPTPGAYKSETTDLWTATGVKSVAGGGACLFLAGNNATPSGYFLLQLASIDDTTAHGDLSLTMFVLPRTADDGSQTDCGPGTTEDVQIHF